jgi:hypothetical protein
MKTRFPFLAAFALLAAAALSACVQGPPATQPEEAEAQALGTVYSLTELATAVSNAGVACDLQQNDRVTAASASGDCSSTTVVMMFDTREDREQIVATLQAISLDGTVSLLVGENWIVNSPEVETLHDSLGGEIVT